MPLRSPARPPPASGRRSVLPPRKKNLPVNSRASGFAARNRASVVDAAFRFDRTISRDTGMCFAPLVVPLDRAKYGTRPGHVASRRAGKAACQ